MSIGYIALIVPATLWILACVRSSFQRHTQVTASCVLILLIWGQAALSASGRSLLAGLMLSIAGDFFLSYRKGRQTWYACGIGCFFCAHVMFLLYGLFQGILLLNAMILFILITTACLIYFIKKLRPVLSSIGFRALVLLYILVSAASFAFAMSLQGNLITRISFPIAIGLILFSDILITQTDFLYNKKHARLIIPTYLAAHLLITAAGLAAVN
jgi:uncharacterized membrane protein YhhN